MRLYPFNSGKYNKFIRAFIALRDELREEEKKDMQLNPARYEDIIKKMIDHEGTRVTTPKDFFSNNNNEQTGGFLHRETKKLRNILYKSSRVYVPTF
jgi:hypothetical protein